MYRRIEAMTDCTKLRAESVRADAYHSSELKAGDVAMAKVSASYKEAAAARMQRISCHG